MFNYSMFCRGYNIGVRLIDEFLAKSNVSRCIDFRETADVIAKVLFRFTILLYAPMFACIKLTFILVKCAVPLAFILVKCTNTFLKDIECDLLIILFISVWFHLLNWFISHMHLCL